MIRGIQIVGLLVALAFIGFVVVARRRGRINGRFFLFWLAFWSIFIVLDVYPSVAGYLSPMLNLEGNMFVLTVGAVLTLFVLVFVLYSFLSDLNRKVTKIVREQAMLDRKVGKLSEVVNGDEKSRDSDSSS